MGEVIATVWGNTRMLFGRISLRGLNVELRTSCVLVGKGFWVRRVYRHGRRVAT